MPIERAKIWQPGPGSLVDLQHPWGQGCVGCWIAGATEHGGYWQDISGQRNDGTLTLMDPATDWVAGRDGWALDFDGENDYVDIGTTWQPISLTAPHTVEAWVYSKETAGYSSIVLLRCTTAGRQWTIGFGFNGHPSYSGLIWGSTSTSWGRFHENRATPVAFYKDTWRHVCVTYKGSDPTTAGSYTAFVDGVEVSVAASLTFGASIDRNSIGSDNSAWFAGSVAKVALYNYALPAEYIRGMYEQPYAMIWTPGTRSTWWFTAAGGDLEITATTAAAAAAGVEASASLEADLEATAETASAAAAGVEATAALDADLEVTADTAAAAAAGVEASALLVPGQNVTAETATAAAAGVEASAALEAALEIACNTAVAVAAGVEATAEFDTILFALNVSHAADKGPLDAAFADTAAVAEVLFGGAGYVDGDVQKVIGSWATNLPALGDLTHLQLQRLGTDGDDTTARPVRVLGVKLEFPVSA